ncbi:aminotransferase class V-fold PLP-dependent enzyme, partial [uncultured Campylobacter sp.]|uniref:aminotransferase class V-fold PLP-dependent enzyme n=1 Tax=uncultured Campylobacter sp. TaxID=218934 RepID=UPI00260550C1
RRESLKDLPLFIISPFEHHSVEISLRQGLCEVVRVPPDPSGLMDFARLGEILSANKGREIYGVLTAASNVTGLKLDYKRAYLMLKAHGGRLFVDASALIAHENVDLGFCDGVFFGAHKFLGGVGASGILAVRKELLRGEEPTFAGGGTIKYADALTQRFIIDKERLEEAGTPGIIALVRAYLALKLRKSAGLEAIKSREEAICRRFISEIPKIPEIEIYGNLTAPRVPIFAFNMQGLGADALAGVLGQKFEIQTRAGCDCAAPYGFDLLGLQPDTEMSRKPAWVRASFSFIHDESDVDFLAEALRQIAQIRDKITFVAGKYRCGSIN